jgi:hypothetical protein
MPYSCRGLAALAVGLLATIPGAHAQRGQAERQAAADEQDQFVLRTYEVGDLVVSVPDYGVSSRDQQGLPGGAVGGGFGGGGGGGGFFSVPDSVGPRATPALAQFGGDGFGGGGPGGRGAASGAMPGASDPMQITFDSLIDAMTSACDPNAWVENGTGKGDVRVVGAALVVWQTPDVHKRIDDFLRQLRDGSARRRTVSIDARWLLLNSDDVDRLVETNDDGVRSLDGQILAEFTRRAGSLRAMSNCFSGQAVYVVSGTRRNVVTSYIPVVGSIEPPRDDIMYASHRSAPVTYLQDVSSSVGGRAVGYQPVVQSVNFGVELRIRPTLMHGESAAVVDLTSTVTFPGQEDQGRVVDPMTSGAATPLVDRLAVDAQELATTLRVPLGKPVLVGGMSHIAPVRDVAIPARQSEEASPPEAAPAPQETPQLYLVLEVR